MAPDIYLLTLIEWKNNVKILFLFLSFFFCIFLLLFLLCFSLFFSFFLYLLIFYLTHFSYSMCCRFHKKKINIRDSKPNHLIRVFSSFHAHLNPKSHKSDGFARLTGFLSWIYHVFSKTIWEDKKTHVFHIYVTSSFWINRNWQGNKHAHITIHSPSYTLLSVRRVFRCFCCKVRESSNFPIS